MSCQCSKNSCSSDSLSLAYVVFNVSLLENTIRFCTSMSPASSPCSNKWIVTPLGGSSRNDHRLGSAPRFHGKYEMCRLTALFRKRLHTEDGTMCRYP